MLYFSRILFPIIFASAVTYQVALFREFSLPQSYNTFHPPPPMHAVCSAHI
jgi:hypothetical protein